MLDIRALARELGYSQKHVISFPDQVGVAAEPLARWCASSADSGAQVGGFPTWADLAARLGTTTRRNLPAT